MALPSKEAQLNLALNALKKDLKLRLSVTAKIYSVSYATLYNRRVGRPSRRDIPANLRKLTDIEVSGPNSIRWSGRWGSGFIAQELR